VNVTNNTGQIKILVPCTVGYITYSMTGEWDDPHCAV
jgi:hypothetical protein